MESSHGAKPSAVEPASFAGNYHKYGDQAQNDKPEHGIKIASHNHNGQQNSHDQLALLSTADFFYF